MFQISTRTRSSYKSVIRQASRSAASQQLPRRPHAVHRVGVMSGTDPMTWEVKRDS